MSVWKPARPSMPRYARQLLGILRKGRLLIEVPELARLLGTNEARAWNAVLRLDRDGLITSRRRTAGLQLTATALGRRLPI